MAIHHNNSLRVTTLAPRHRQQKSMDKITENEFVGVDQHSGKVYLTVAEISKFGVIQKNKHWTPEQVQARVLELGLTPYNEGMGVEPRYDPVPLALKQRKNN